MCHNILNIDQFNIVSQDSDAPLDYEFDNFVDLRYSSSPLLYTNERTSPLPPRYSPRDADTPTPSCFFYDLLPQLFGRDKYTAQKDSMKSFLESAEFDKYVQNGSWKNCAICYAPFKIKHSLNMRFDFSLPEDPPPPRTYLPPELLAVYALLQKKLGNSSTDALLSNIYKIDHLRLTLFNNAGFQTFQTAFFGQLKCQNTVQCEGQEQAPYACCMRHLYHPVTPSTFTFGSVDLAPVPSSTPPPPFLVYPSPLIDLLHVFTAVICLSYSPCLPQLSAAAFSTQTSRMTRSSHIAWCVSCFLRAKAAVPL